MQGRQNNCHREGKTGTLSSVEYTHRQLRKNQRGQSGKGDAGQTGDTGHTVGAQIGMPKQQADDRFGRSRQADHHRHAGDPITLGLENREAKIEQYKQHLRDLGEAGIPYTTYAHMANGI